MQIAEQRAQAVRETIETVRAIEAKHGVTRETLNRIKPVLVELASRTELFAPESFGNLPGRPGTLFHLAEDPDGRFALYGSAGAPGKAQPPHNHTTWACIAGVYGDEHNVFYDRVDDRKVTGEGRLAKTGELTVVKGNACAFLPDDFHTIEVVNGKESLHLHLYGKTLEDLPERVYFGCRTQGFDRGGRRACDPRPARGGRVREESPVPCGIVPAVAPGVAGRQAGSARRHAHCPHG